VGDPISVTRISHAPLKGVHSGDQTYTAMQWQVVEPSSVPGPASNLLTKTTANAVVRCYYFETVDVGLVPSNFAAAASPTINDFGNVNIFFHPNPAKAKPPMLEGDYPDLGTWASLYRYAPIMGVQLSQAAKDQIFIMPYVPARMFKTTGSFASNWATLVRDIARLIKQDIKGVDDDSLTMNNVLVSSFSFGIEASDGFRKSAPGLTPLLREIWDLDGMFSDSRQISISLRNTQLPKLIQHQQSLPPTLGNSFYVGLERWTGIAPGLVPLMKTNLLAAQKEVHRLIGQALFFHACKLSSVG
jgi:hypothetical protein